MTISEWFALNHILRHKENMRFLKSIAAPLLGILFLVTGFIYDLLFAGIPYQDPTAELQAKYDFHSSVAGLFYKTGGIVFLLGLLAIPVILRMTKKKK